MSTQNLTKPLGFLTIIRVPELGYCGGYLLINSLGRPVEFHCTAPVPENRTQKILYGKTYESFLFCDQIGRALVAKAKQTTGVIIADRIELASMQESLTQPLILLQEKSNSVDNTESAGSSIVHETFSIGDHGCVALSHDPAQLTLAKSYCHALNATIPLDEPFERIRQAIDEAQAVIR